MKSLKGLLGKTLEDPSTTDPARHQFKISMSWGSLVWDVPSFESEGTCLQKFLEINSNFKVLPGILLKLIIIS